MDCDQDLPRGFSTMKIMDWVSLSVFAVLILVFFGIILYDLWSALGWWIPAIGFLVFVLLWPFMRGDNFLK